MRTLIGRILVFTCLAGLFLMSTGCVTAPTYPLYPLTSDMKKIKLTPFKKNGVNLMLPDGWKEVALPPNSNERQKAIIEKAGLGKIVFFCGGMLVKNEDLREVALAASTPESEVLAGPNSIAMSGYKPGFEIRMESSMQEGKKLPYVGYYGWKGSNGFTCNYYVVGVGNAAGHASQAEAVEAIKNMTKEFVVIISNMK